MSFSSRRRNYMLVSHRRDELIEWMKKMLQHSFVLDALAQSAPDTMSHFEMLIDEHRFSDGGGVSRLKQLVPSIGTFHTPLPLRRAFFLYDEKYKVTKRRHVCLSFNEIRQILNLAQVMALCEEEEKEERRQRRSESTCSVDNVPSAIPETLTSFNGDKVKRKFTGPKMITFDGDQTLYTDGKNFESNPKLAMSLTLLLENNVTCAIVTAAGYEYAAEKYEYRITGLLDYFKSQKLTEEQCSRFYMFGGECNYLLRLGADFHLHPVEELGDDGWMTSSSLVAESPFHWKEDCIDTLLDIAQKSLQSSLELQNIRGRVIRKKRGVGLIPNAGEFICREALDETVLSVQAAISSKSSTFQNLPYCAFNGGSDCWVDCGNKRVGVSILQSYLSILPKHCLHVGDQFLNTGNDFAARGSSCCAWITSPVETGYILKKLLEFAGGVDVDGEIDSSAVEEVVGAVENVNVGVAESKMNPYTGKIEKV